MEFGGSESEGPVGVEHHRGAAVQLWTHKQRVRLGPHRVTQLDAERESRMLVQLARDRVTYGSAFYGARRRENIGLHFCHEDRYEILGSPYSHERNHRITFLPMKTGTKF